MNYGRIVLFDIIGEWLRVAADFIRDRSFAPTAGLLHLADAAVWAMMLLFVAYGGMLFGHLLFSLLFNVSDRVQASKSHNVLNLAIMKSPVLKFWPGVLLGATPLFSIGLCYASLFHGKTGWVSLFYILAGAAMLGTALFARLYHFTYPLRDELPLVHFGFGALAFAHVGGVIHLFGAGSHLALNPEFWPLIHGNLQRIVFSWNLLWGMKLFVVSGLLTTATFLYFRLHGWADAKDDREGFDEARELFHRRFVLTIAVLASLGVGATLVLFVTTLQQYIVTPPVLALAAVALVLLLAISQSALSKVFSTRSESGTSLFVLVLAALLCMIGAEQTARARSTRDLTNLLLFEADARLKESEAKREELAAGAVKPDGAKVFEKACASCHAFDVKKVGPAYKDVLGKYAAAPEKLREFIANPTKIDPAFPPMPKPAVNAAEVEAVADYLLATHSSPAATAATVAPKGGADVAASK